jgi:hypothetical protein
MDWMCGRAVQTKQKQNRAKWTGCVVEQYSTCFASAKPRVQTPGPPKKKNE